MSNLPERILTTALSRRQILRFGALAGLSVASFALCFLPAEAMMTTMMRIQPQL